MVQSRAMFDSSSGASTSFITQNGLGWCLKIAINNATADSAFSPPQSSSTFCKRFPGGGEAGPEAWERYDSQSFLGQNLAGERKYSEAEPLLISGYEGLNQRRNTIPAFDRRDVESAGEQIVRLYEDWRKPDKAQEWRARVRADQPASKPE